MTMTDTAPQIAGLEELIRRAPAARDELLALAEGELAKLAGELTEVLERYKEIAGPLAALEAQATGELTASAWGAEEVQVADAIGTVVRAIVGDPMWDALADLRDRLGEAIGDES